MTNEGCHYRPHVEKRFHWILESRLRLEGRTEKEVAASEVANSPLLFLPAFSSSTTEPKCDSPRFSSRKGEEATRVGELSSLGKYM